MKIFYLTFLGAVLFACSQDKETASVTDGNDYPIRPVDIRQVKLTDRFWLPVIKTVQNKTIHYALEKCNEEGRMENFLIAGGKLQGETRGAMPFDDTDVYKIIEGASYSLVSAPDKKLEAYLDTLISIVKTGQEADGYLTTWRTINGSKPPAAWVNPGKRWEHLAASHELYNSGHMFEAAVAHYRATGKRSFLDIAVKNADLLVSTFGPGKLELLPGHQIVETGLIKLYRVTQNEDYLQLARYFLDQRGDSATHELFGAYSQDHLPVTQQDEVVGHAVRAVYMYAGMTDIAALQHDEAYRLACHRLWENMVNKKMYITGGIGARHEGESFGENYELPNLTAYAETCAAIGSVYWNHRLFMLTGEVKYYDVIERTLYNGLLAGLSLDGEKFFYPNALESDGKYTFNQGACTRKSWFDCSCCPTNMIRFLPSVPGLIYSSHADTLFVNLFASNEALVDIGGDKIKISQTTNYPWDGEVKIRVEPEKDFDFVLKIRIPGWARGEVAPGDLYSYENQVNAKPVLLINGVKQDVSTDQGYLTLSRKWKPGEEIVLTLPMEVRLVKSNDQVVDNRQKTALEYGPIVYCFEEADNMGRMDDLEVTSGMRWKIEKQPDLLGGINVISTNDEEEAVASMAAIPYYAWSNRGVGAMKVWVPYRK